MTSLKKKLSAETHNFCDFSCTVYKNIKLYMGVIDSGNDYRNVIFVDNGIIKSFDTEIELGIHSVFIENDKIILFDTVSLYDITNNVLTLNFDHIKTTHVMNHVMLDEYVAIMNKNNKTLFCYCFSEVVKGSYDILGFYKDSSRHEVVAKDIKLPPEESEFKFYFSTPFIEYDGAQYALGKSCIGNRFTRFYLCLLFLCYKYKIYDIMRMKFDYRECVDWRHYFKTLDIEVDIKNITGFKTFEELNTMLMKFYDDVNMYDNLTEPMKIAVRLENRKSSLDCLHKFIFLIRVTGDKFEISDSYMPDGNYSSYNPISMFIENGKLFASIGVSDEDTFIYEVNHKVIYGREHRFIFGGNIIQ